MGEPTRRRFLAIAGAGAASVGAVAIGRGALDARSTVQAEEPAAVTADDAAQESLVVHVKDVRKGRMAIMAGEDEVLIEDRALAARLAAATR